MRQALFAAIIVLLGTASCQKKDDPLADTTQVVTTVTSPADGQVFSSGDNVHIAADISYTAELHGYQVTIVDTANGTVLYDADEDIHADHFSISKDWTATGTQQKSLRLSVIAILNHQGVKSTSTRYIVVKP